MRVAIVGAGIAGLAAARTLAQAGASPVVFEKSRGPGGRCATRRQGPFTFDTGATSIAARGRELGRVMQEELPTDDLVQVPKPIWVHESLRVAPGNPAHMAVHRYTYRTGINTLGKLLAAGLELRAGATIEGITRAEQGWHVGGEDWDAVVLAAPVPQSAALLWSAGVNRAVAGARYRPCISVLLGFERTTPDLPYHALLDPEQSHPLTWLSVENVKAPGRMPDGLTAFVAQMSPRFSLQFYTREDQEILDDVVGFVQRLYGPDWKQPAVADVKRWKYSQPESLALFETVNKPGMNLVLAGDGLIGGRVELAYESGVRAARLLLEKP